MVQDICLGCHGIGGQRQFHIDDKATTGQCTDFTREMVNAVPWPADNPSAAHANYGMLARDGITCTTCHRMVLNTEAARRSRDAPQNACVDGAPGAAQPGGIAALPGPSPAASWSAPPTS